MDRIPVDSTTLASIGYEAETRTLELEFTSRTIYQYTNVPRYVFLDLFAAPSKGRYFNRKIKDRYRFRKI